jgi:hypothetical protein
MNHKEHETISFLLRRIYACPARNDDVTGTEAVEQEELLEGSSEPSITIAPAFCMCIIKIVVQFVLGHPKKYRTCVRLALYVYKNTCMRTR